MSLIFFAQVSRFYADVRSLERVSDQEMYAAMAAHSRTHKPAFNTKNALKELHSYAVKYSSEVRVDNQKMMVQNRQKQGPIRGYPSRVQVDRGRI